MKAIIVIFLFVNTFIFSNSKIVANSYNSFELTLISSDSMSISKLIVNAPLIIEGVIEPLDYSEFNSRVFKVKITKVLKGNLESKTIYLIESFMLDSQEGPAALFSAEYILFLEKDQILGDSKDIVNKLRIRNDNVFHVFNNWRGAICLDNKWSEMVNYYIERNYGINRVEIKSTIEELCSNYNEKRTNNSLKNYKNKIYQEFDIVMNKKKNK